MEVGVKTYRFELCRRDGTTPLGETTFAVASGEDRHRAEVAALAENPGCEVVSWECVQLQPTG